MTRINSAILVKCLTDEHLLAEHREIKRLTFNLDRAISSGSIHRIPEKFVLGNGHVLFFLDKMRFTFNRYSEIYDELKTRGYSPTSFHSNWSNVPDEFFNDYNATEEERKLLEERITERIENSKKEKFHYYKNIISKNDAIKILRENKRI